MLATKKSAGVTPEVNLRECISHIYMPLPSTNKATDFGFETQRRHHQKSKKEVSVAPQKGLMSSKIDLKKNKKNFNYVWVDHVSTLAVLEFEANVKAFICNLKLVSHNTNK